MPCYGLRGREGPVMLGDWNWHNDKLVSPGFMHGTPSGDQPRSTYTPPLVIRTSWLAPLRSLACHLQEVDGRVEPSGGEFVGGGLVAGLRAQIESRELRPLEPRSWGASSRLDAVGHILKALDQTTASLSYAFSEASDISESLVRDTMAG